MNGWEIQKDQMLEVVDGEHKGKVGAVVYVKQSGFNHYWPRIQVGDEVISVRAIDVEPADDVEAS